MSTFVYQLRFGQPHLTESKKPEIFFVFPRRQFDCLMELHREQASQEHKGVLKYYYTYLDDETPFQTSPDMFGFGGCSYCKSHGEDEEIRLPMVRAKCAHLSATVSYIAMLAGILLAEERDTDLPLQKIQFDAHCRNEMHGHSVYGSIYPALGRWLKAQHGRLDSSVTRAMKLVWRELCIPGQEGYARECSASLSHDGRFIFGCFGDACDLAIYPDQGSDDLEVGRTRFSCHNLDAARQQLTLLGGLAQMLTTAG